MNPSAKDFPGYIYVGDIHSHASMSAFHSGVDDKDDGDGIHITVGDLDEIIKKGTVSISCSFVSNKIRFSNPPENHIEGIKKFDGEKTQSVIEDKDEDSLVLDNDIGFGRYYGFDMFRFKNWRADNIITTNSDKKYYVKLENHDSRWISFVKNEAPIHMNNMNVITSSYCRPNNFLSQNNSNIGSFTYSKPENVSEDKSKLEEIKNGEPEEPED
jgi:hypothetical protein